MSQRNTLINSKCVFNERWLVKNFKIKRVWVHLHLYCSLHTSRRRVNIETLWQFTTQTSPQSAQKSQLHFCRNFFLYFFFLLISRSFFALLPFMSSARCVSVPLWFARCVGRDWLWRCSHQAAANLLISIIQQIPAGTFGRIIISPPRTAAHYGSYLQGSFVFMFHFILSLCSPPSNRQAACARRILPLGINKVNRVSSYLISSGPPQCVCVGVGGGQLTSNSSPDIRS